MSTNNIHVKSTRRKHVNPCPADPGYSLSLQTVFIQKKPTDLDLHCLSISIWIRINNMYQVIWLAESYKWAWRLSLFSMTRVKDSALNKQWRSWNGIYFTHTQEMLPSIASEMELLSLYDRKLFYDLSLLQTFSLHTHVMCVMRAKSVIHFSKRKVNFENSLHTLKT